MNSKTGYENLRSTFPREQLIGLGVLLGPVPQIMWYIKPCYCYFGHTRTHTHNHKHTHTHTHTHAFICIHIYIYIIIGWKSGLLDILISLILHSLLGVSLAGYIMVLFCFRYLTVSQYHHDARPADHRRWAHVNACRVYLVEVCLIDYLSFSLQYMGLHVFNWSILV